jgi:hypothetical protein
MHLISSSIDEALGIASKDLDRLILARELMSGVTAKTRSNSRLSGLVELFPSRPLVTVLLGAKLLKVTPKAVDLMLAQLGAPCRGSSPDAPATAPGASCETLGVHPGGWYPPLCPVAHPLPSIWLISTSATAPDGRTSMAASAQPSTSAAHTPSFGTALIRFAVAFPLMTAAMVLVSAIPG